MIKLLCHNRKNFFVVIVAGVCFAMIMFTYLYRMNPYLWFDEAGQFWIAKGLNHDSAPLSPEGNIFDVVENNRFYNLDPGGFGVILHFWSKISNNYIWLRTLPLLSFLLVCVCLVYYVIRKTKNQAISLLVGLVPFLYPLLYNEGLELRAYSMEALGVVVGICCVDWIKQNLTLKRLIISSGLLCIFVTSRYSFLVVAFVISCYVLWLIFKSGESVKRRLVYAIAYGFPLLLFVAIEYFTSFQFQTSGGSKCFYMKYLCDNPKMLLWDTGLPFMLNLFVIFFLWLNRKRSLIAKHESLLFITLATNLIFIILSYLGLHPWTPDYKHCLSMIMLVFICNIVCFAEFCSFVSDYVNVKWFVLILVLFMFGTNVQNIKALKRNEDSNSLVELRNMNLSSFDKIYCDRWESPCLRYQYEYGSLKDKKDSDYHKYYFQTMLKHSIYTKGNAKSEWYSRQPDLNDLLEYDMLIVPELSRYRVGNQDKWKEYKEGIFVKND